MYTQTQTMTDTTTNQTRGTGADVKAVEVDDSDDADFFLTAVPCGWSHVLDGEYATGKYVRMLDGVMMNLADANALTVPQPVKQENYTTLPAIVKFYSEQCTYCSPSQATAIFEKWMGALRSISVTSQLEELVTFQSSFQFWSQNTQSVQVQLILRIGDLRIGDQSPELLTIAKTVSVDERTVDEYALHTNKGQFPTLMHIIQHIPGIYTQMVAEMGTFQTTDLSKLYPFKSNIRGNVQIQKSLLNIDTRKVIIEIDNEEAELNTKLEELRKRKRDIEEVTRNVRNVRNCEKC